MTKNPIPPAVEDDPADGAELPTPNTGDDAGVDEDGNELTEHGTDEA